MPLPTCSCPSLRAHTPPYVLIPLPTCSSPSLRAHRTFRDLGNLTAGEVAGLSDADLTMLQSDKRVLAQMNKSEL